MSNQDKVKEIFHIRLRQQSNLVDDKISQPPKGVLRVRR